MKNLIFLSIILTIPGYLFAQNNEQKSSPNYLIESNFHIGKIINNYIYNDTFPPRKIAYLYEIRFANQSNGNKNWMQDYKFPEVGVSLVLGSLGNQKELGQVLGIVPNLTFRTIKQEKFSMKVSLGIGLAAFNKPFNAATNTHNIMIGSHITNMTYLKLFFRNQLSDNLEFIYGASAFHCSNGHYQVPNAGMNLPALFTGITWRPSGQPYFYPKREIAHSKGNLKWNIFSGIGVHEFAYTLGPIGGLKYKIINPEFYLSKRMGKFSNVLLGVDFKYYSNYRQYLNTNFPDEKNINLQSSILTIFLGHEFIIGHFGLSAQSGINCYYPFYEKYYTGTGFNLFLERYITTKIGIQYYFFNPDKFVHNLYLGAYVKANFGTADFILAGLGYSF